MNGVIPSPVVAEKALRLLEQSRVFAGHSDEEAARMVARGDTDSYLVVARPNGVFCGCTAGGNPDPVSCSHKVAAQIAWAES